MGWRPTLESTDELSQKNNEGMAAGCLFANDGLMLP